MPNKEKKGSDLEKKYSPASEVLTIDGSLEAETELVEGQIAEIAKDKTEKNQVSSSSKSNGPTKVFTKNDAILNDREMLRAQLLKNAPQPRVMHMQIKTKLEERKKELNLQLKSVSKKDYYTYSSVLAQLRSILRDITNIAKLSLDSLRDLWLRIVHNFA